MALGTGCCVGMAAAAASSRPSAAQLEDGVGGADLGGYDIPLEQLLGLPDSPMGESSEELPRPRLTLDFEDHREERRHCGLLKWKVEKGVPDVGGLGWRSRQGHLLKNQTFYSSNPKENLWDNPTLAGPNTWKEWHGPRLRSDAPLMARLDRLEAEQADHEAKKHYVNAVRVQTLDRFYNLKVENQQKEMASQWAPHRRAKKEVHESLNCFEAELDSMPVKELKKVLTPAVLQGDRNAIRMITTRVQAEETWRAAWRDMEKERRDDIRATHEQRSAYNDMLMDLAGQQGRLRQPDRTLPDSATPRTRELSQPTGPRHVTSGAIGVTQLIDYKGLIHVDHKHALEARLPGQGHELCAALAARATESARPGWPPPPPPETPRPQRRRNEDLSEGSLRKAAVPVSAARVPSGLLRYEEETMSSIAARQFLSASAPPPPDQNNSMLHEALVNDPLHMSQDHSARSNHTSRDRMGPPTDCMGLAPPLRSTVYPVVVPTVEAGMERPNWRPKRSARGASSSLSFVHAPPGATAAAASAAAPAARNGDLSAKGGSHSGGDVAELSMPNTEPTTRAVCSHLDAFEAGLVPVPRLGNFWMTPRGERTPKSTTG